MPGTSLVDIIKKMVEEFEKKPIKYLNTKETNEKLSTSYIYIYIYI